MDSTGKRTDVYRRSRAAIGWKMTNERASLGYNTLKLYTNSFCRQKERFRTLMKVASGAQRKAALGKNRDHKVEQNPARENPKIKKTSSHALSNWIKVHFSLI